jgi:hypothetical protein
LFFLKKCPLLQKNPKKSKLVATVGNFAKNYTASYHLQEQDPNSIPSIFVKYYSNHVQNHARHCANAQTVVIRGYVVFSGLMILFPKSKMDR